MNQTPRIVFSGNRFPVLEEILVQNFNVILILPVLNSYLERDLSNRMIPFTTISGKEQLIETLENTDFDIFISNGLPYKLPISKLRSGTNKQFINIHPSYLPDLRGSDPVPGAILFRRDSGATCHVMNDELDQGDIIAQVKIPYDPFWDAISLYQLSFVAEREAFKEAAKLDFRATSVQKASAEHLYYTCKDLDQVIDFDQTGIQTTARVKAFSNRSKGAIFSVNGKSFKTFDAELLTREAAAASIKMLTVRHREIISVMEDQILVRIHDELIKLKKVTGDLSGLRAGDLV